MREGEWFFKRKPTLASLFPHLGAVECLNLSPSLTPSAVKMRDNLGCLLCLPLILFPSLLFEAFLLKFKITLVCLLFSPFLLSAICIYVLVCFILMCLPLLHMFIYGSLHVAWLIITAVIITYRHNCVMVNMTEWSPPRNAVSIVNATEA